MDKLYFNRSPIIGVDFDGTVVRHEWPELGPPVPGAIEWLRRFTAAGARLLLWTNRSGIALAEAVAYLKAHNVELWAINENPEQGEWTTSPKPYMHLLIDDNCYGMPLIGNVGKRPSVDWSIVGPAVFRMITHWKPEAIH